MEDLIFVDFSGSEAWNAGMLRDLFIVLSGPSRRFMSLRLGKLGRADLF